MGTYDDPEMSFSEELQWVDEQLADQYNGGEMPSPGARNEPENAHAEFQRLHIGYLNQMYNQKILDSWRESEMPGAGGESDFSFIAIWATAFQPAGHRSAPVCVTLIRCRFT